MSILQDLIPEAIPSQKCDMNMDLILSGYDMGIWNDTWFGNCFLCIYWEKDCIVQNGHHQLGFTSWVVWKV